MINIYFRGMRGQLGGGDYPSLFPMFGLGGSKRHILEHDITFEG
jgi:hypothetical protein